MKNVKINREQLRQRCLMTEQDYFEEGVVVPTRGRGVNAQDSFYIFQDNGAKILAVAHLDTVLSTQSNWTFEEARLGGTNDKRTFLWNAQLDDRLGAYIILDLIPSLIGKGHYDILLTTDEEIGASTAENFVAPDGKQYNWIFQFDRRGTGAVLYQYQGGDWTPAISEFLTVQQGSFSDISRLDHLGCKAVNVGTGYHDEHRDMCYMVVEETESQVRKFLRFFYTHKDAHFPHTKTYRSTTVYTPTRYGGFNNADWDRWGEDSYGEGTGGTALARVFTQPADSTTKYLTNNGGDGNAHARAYPPNWINNVNVTTFSMKFSTDGAPVIVYVHPNTGKQAVACDMCDEADLIETMHWSIPDGRPICEWCFNHNTTPEAQENGFLDVKPPYVYIEEHDSDWHSEDRLRWVGEGGSVRKQGHGWIRVNPRWEYGMASRMGGKRTAVSCARCQQAEWEEKAVIEKGAGKRGQDVHFCRWCHEHISGEGDADDEVIIVNQTVSDEEINYAEIIDRLGVKYDETMLALDNIIDIDGEVVDLEDTQELHRFREVVDPQDMVDELNRFDDDGNTWHYVVDETTGRSFFTNGAGDERDAQVFWPGEEDVQ